MMVHSMIRSVQRAPAFAMVVILLIAGVVAINASAFSAIHALRWKALPYADSDNLLELRGDMQKFGFVAGLNASIRSALAADREHFSGVAGFAIAGQERVDSAGQGWRLAEVTPGFERVLGIAPAIGRSFVEGDAVKGADQVLLISDQTWHSRFDADPAIVGRMVDLGKTKLGVIGVMPPGFAFPDTQIDAWRPYVSSSDSGSVGGLEVVARTTAGTSIKQAQATLDSVITKDKQLVEMVSSAGLKASARPWRERYSAGHQQALGLLQLSALVLLAVAVANLINLYLDHLLGRRREFGIRRALGASERVIALGIAADVLTPAMVGLVLGLALTPLGLQAISDRGLLPENLPQSAAFGPATIFAGCIATALVLATILLAVWITQRRQGLSSRGGFAGMGRLRPALMLGQVMVTTVLLGGSALLLRSAINLVSTDPGFSEQGVLMTMVDPLGVSADDADFNPESDAEKLRVVFARMRDELASLPGVDHVALANAPPFSHSEVVSTVQVPGIAEAQSARLRFVSPDYFVTLGIGLEEGRGFTSKDAGDASPVIVDTVYRERYLQGAKALGSQVGIGSKGGDYRDARIIGVARSVKQDTLDEASGLPTIYSFTQAPTPVAFLLAHTLGDARLLAEAARQRILAMHPGAVIMFNKPLADSVAETLAPRRALLEAIVGFGVATLLLASIGLAAVLSFSIRRRSAELGLRLAIGATPLQVRNLVLRQGGMLVATGGILGLFIGVPLARLLGDRLYRIEFTDVASWLAALACVVVVAFLACWLPARRAAATDPMVALRDE